MRKIDKALKEYEKLDESIKNRYSLRCNTMYELSERQKIFDIICDAFKFGFIRSMRCQKAQEKRSE